MDYILIDGWRGSRQARPRRQDFPQWGLEEPRREWNGHSMYRGGQKCLLNRYLITPKALPVLDYGVTVLDALACIGTALILGLFTYAFILGIGHGIDGWLDACGY